MECCEGKRDNTKGRSRDGTKDNSYVSEKKQDTYLVVLPNLTNQVGERLVDVNPLLSGSLDKLATEVLGEITALWKHVSVTEIRRQVGMQIPDRNPQWLPRKEYNVPFMPT